MVIYRSHGGLSANGKEENNAWEDKTNYVHFSVVVIVYVLIDVLFFFKNIYLHSELY